jgi:hypothetical protein
MDEIERREKIQYGIKMKAEFVEWGVEKDGIEKKAFM